MQTVAETPTFIKQTEKLLDEDERKELIDYLAANPTAGDKIEGTGGIRKLRFATKGKGKRGGARVIYFYHSPGVPVFALAAYAKNKKVDLTDKEKRTLKGLVNVLLERNTL